MFVRKAWLFIFLLVLSADYGFLVQLDRQSHASNSELDLYQWSLVSQVVCDVDCSIELDDVDAIIGFTGFSPDTYIDLSFNYLIALSLSFRYQLQPRTSQGPPTILSI